MRLLTFVKKDFEAGKNLNISCNMCKFHALKCDEISSMDFYYTQQTRKPTYGEKRGTKYLGLNGASQCFNKAFGYHIYT